MQRLTEKKTGSCGVTSHLVTHDKHGRAELLAVRPKAVHAACRQTWAVKDRGDVKLFFEEDVGKKREHEIFHGKLSTLFIQFWRDSGEGDVPRFSCDEVNGSGDETRDFTGLIAAEQSVLLDVPDEIWESSIANVLYVAVCARRRQQPSEISTRSRKERGFRAEKASFKLWKIEIICSLVLGRLLSLHRDADAHSWRSLRSQSWNRRRSDSWPGDENSRPSGAEWLVSHPQRDEAGYKAHRSNSSPQPTKR